ncbi:chemotaxis protein CheB [Nonomuraea sp. NPDC050783]|uniref:chemotaxis protein CheB n=1 Tax=Nonomuraea sp. NPDC050783 TaxID=3154634 RepID=UPI0034677C63
MSATVQNPGAGGSAFDLVCLTASLGGVRAYAELLARLPQEFPAPVVLVQHRSAGRTDQLTAVLQRHCALPVVTLAAGRPLEAGTVHVVPAERRAVFTSEGPVELRPADGYRAGDGVFTSAARVYGPRLIAAVLTGRLDDGAAGVRHVKGAGGRVLAQDEASCAPLGFQMPAAAIATGCVDFVLPLDVLADAIVALVMNPGAAGMMRVALPPWARAVNPAATPDPVVLL